MKKIKPINYIILAIIFILTIGTVIYLEKAYTNKSNYANANNERLNILYEIKKDDIANYLVENTEIIIYMSDSKDQKLNEFEDKLKIYISSNDLTKEVVYLNENELQQDFYDNLKEKYFSESLKKRNVDLLMNQANMLVVENGKIVDILYYTATEPTITDAMEFLKTNLEITND